MAYDRLKFDDDDEYAPENTKFGKNNAKYGPFRRSRSFKFTDIGTNRKLIYDFLLVINTNLPTTLHCFGDTLDWSPNPSAGPKCLAPEVSLHLGVFNIYTDHMSHAHPSHALCE